MSSAMLRRLVTVVLLVLLGGAAMFLWKHSQPPGLPSGIAMGNGRLEATEVDVATKVAGRLAVVHAHEGDDVTHGQTVAELDADDLKARLRAAEAQVRQARAAAQESRAGLASAASQRKLAAATLGRTEELVKKGFVTSGKLDQDRSALQSAEASVAAAQSRVSEALAAVGAAEAQVDVLRVALGDTALQAPIAGRVLYRFAQPGEILATGGKVLTLLDMNDVFMSIYLPAAEAGKVGVGATARIVLDALPEQPIPARVVFVAPRSQFTPKEVETRSEREKLMFRVKVRIDADWLATHAALAKPGMPGLAYVTIDPGATWPPALTPR